MKQLAVKIVKRGMGVLPNPLLATLVRSVPKLHVGLPEGRTFDIDWYLGDVRVKVDTTYVIERAMLSGRYDPQTVSIIKRIAKPGDVCMDVGANVGAIAFAIAKQIGPEGKLLAFEPGNLTYTRLLHNLSLNPVLGKSIVPLQLGLSDQDGFLYWQEHDNNRGNANLTTEVQNGGLKVPVTTVDGYFAKHPVSRLDFVKIDVESMEYEVIKGGMETWARHLPALYYETLPAFEAFRAKPVFKMIEEMLKPLGYAFFKMQGDGSLKETAYPDLSANTLALPPKRIPQPLNP